MSLYWTIRRHDQMPAATDWLSPLERDHLAGLRFEKRRRDWLLGRWTSKRAVEAVLRRPELAFQKQLPERDVGDLSISILPAADGAPEVWLAGRPMDLNVSISHRDGLAICVVAPGPIRPGCDLERIEERSEAFVEDFFTAAERRWWLSRPETERALWANLFWSAKESALKVLRSGLRADTRSVQIDLDSLQFDASPSGWLPLGVTHEDRMTLGGWWRRQGSFVQTAVSDPPAPPPVHLNPLGLF